MKCSLLAQCASFALGPLPLLVLTGPAGAQTAAPDVGGRTTTARGSAAGTTAALADSVVRRTVPVPSPATTTGSAAPREPRPVRRRRHAVATPSAVPARGAAASLGGGGQVVTFRFASPGADSAREPVLTCAVLRACVVDLEPGERLLVLAPIIGDAVRWRTGIAPSGPGGSGAIVWIKPTDCNLATNLVLPTDRRVYHLALDSGPCGSPDARVRYVSHARFTYPEDSARAPGRGDRAPAVGTATGALGTEAQAFAGIPVDALRLNFSYDLRRDRRFPWSPARVFDDGAHTFIQLPPEADAYAAPALFELDEGGSKKLLNYVVRDGFYVTDRTFRRAVLVVGQGKQEQRFALENRAYGRVPAQAATDRRAP